MKETKLNLILTKTELEELESLLALVNLIVACSNHKHLSKRWDKDLILKALTEYSFENNKIIDRQYQHIMQILHETEKESKEFNITDFLNRVNVPYLDDI